MDGLSEAGGGLPLADVLAGKGLLEPAWRAVFERVRRHEFIPDRIWVAGADGYHRVVRADDPQRWQAAACGDTAVVTRVEEPGDPPFARVPASSASAPGVAAVMLRAADVAEGVRVLEVGTGTGYNAALLATRLGADRVVSVEVDAGLAAAAREALARAGLPVLVVTGDGAAGWPPGAPFDRVVAACAVHQVPCAWIAQTRPAGVVTPWATAFHNGVLLRAVVGGDGTATARVAGDASFMWLRAQRPPTRDVMACVHDEAAAVRTATGVDPRTVLDDDAAFTVGVRVPGVRHTLGRGSGAEAGEATLWLADPASDSWASVDHEPGRTSYPVDQYGPRRLWDEVETALRWWHTTGRPARTRFGLTINPEHHTVWLDHPHHTISTTPAQPPTACPSPHPAEEATTGHTPATPAPPTDATL